MQKVGRQTRLVMLNGLTRRYVLVEYGDHGGRSLQTGKEVASCKEKDKVMHEICKP